MAGHQYLQLREGGDSEDEHTSGSALLQTAIICTNWFQWEPKGRVGKGFHSGARWCRRWGVTEGERLFIKQVKMETQGDIDIFNYPQIYSNFLLFLTTPPTGSLMGVLNKGVEIAIV